MISLLLCDQNGIGKLYKIGKASVVHAKHFESRSQLLFMKDHLRSKYCNYVITVVDLTLCQ